MRTIKGKLRKNAFDDLFRVKMQWQFVWLCIYFSFLSYIHG